MKPIPMIFRPELAQAIFEGRKTVTRRTVGLENINIAPDSWESSGWYRAFGDLINNLYVFEHREKKHVFVKCPYIPGREGWVREKHLIYQVIEYTRRNDGRAFSEVSDGMVAYYADGYGSISDFKAHIITMSSHSIDAVEVKNDKWRPSIHMPQWAARSWFRIVSCRAELLQNITPEDAIREGFESISKFFAAWDNIHATDGMIAAVNPWVWRIEFERIAKPEERS